MRILLVSHDFLPNHPAGTEIYTFQFGSELQRRGHEVHVFTTEKDIGRKHLSVEAREYEGLTVHELFNNLFYQSYEQTWDYPAVARTFANFLDDLRPDVVHFMHLMYLSVGCVEEAAARVPVFYTLHDYWLQCARFGQRVHSDRSICHTIDFRRCGECLVDFKYAQTPTERRIAKGVAFAKGLTGVDLGPMARRTAARLKKSGDALKAPPPGSLRMPEGEQPEAPALEALGPEARVLHDHVLERDRALRERVLPWVSKFIAPSRFLRDSFVDWGIPEDQIMHVRTGIDVSRFEVIDREPAERLRVGFIGTVVPHKGLHVLLEAWRQLPVDIRERAELKVWGPTDHTPEYVNALQLIADELDVPMQGRLAARDVPSALREIDLLVVPSVWYENSPLIILEALATRTPLMVSNLGGMAELVEPGRSGYRFEVGDASDLGHRLRLLIEDPSPLGELYAGELPVQSVDRDAEILSALYDDALATRAEARD
ncbi:MAG: glycosyltransferase [Planctomycetota bacterium]|jgi:glycosyltransferase involved in cell wall biosynthesis